MTTTRRKHLSIALRLRYGPVASSLVGTCLLSLSLSGCGRSLDRPPAGTIVAKVLKVIDGDTVRLRSGDKVRYIGMDAPEKGECYADEALEFNRSLVEGKEIRLELDERLIDPFGRLLAYVYVDTLFVNAALVREGFARAAAYPPDTKYEQTFERLEAQAGRERRGLWGACENAR